MKELLANIDDKHCVLDLCIENEDRNNRQISKESQGFLDNKKSELIKEYNAHLSIKSISEMYGKEFIIPAYQRGYRDLRR